MNKLLVMSGLIMTTLLQACAYDRGHMRDGGHMMDNYYHGGVFMWITIIILLVAAGFAAWFFIKKGGSSQSESALDILKKRYARGEITKKEYDATKKDLL